MIVQHPCLLHHWVAIDPYLTLFATRIEAGFRHHQQTFNSIIVITYVFASMHS